MNLNELAKLKAVYPTALNIWYDRMHDLTTGQLIETLLVHMDKGYLLCLLGQIQNEINQEKEFDHGPDETTE